MERLLIDECLSPGLAALARQMGWDATHVTFLDKGSWQDYSLIDTILAGDYIFVTQNARDFRKLFSRLAVHNGLIILIPKAKRDEQMTLLAAALEFVRRLEHTINRVVEVHAPDDIRLSNLPPED